MKKLLPFARKKNKYAEETKTKNKFILLASIVFIVVQEKTPLHLQTHTIAFW